MAALHPPVGSIYVPADIKCPVEGISIYKYLVASDADKMYSRYRSEFELESEEHIGTGAFGIVVKCKNVIDKQTYAIKKISLGKMDEQEDVYGGYNESVWESIILASLDHRHVVRYYSAWPESTFVGETGGEKIDKSKPCLYIQMQLCDSTLVKKMESTTLTMDDKAEIFDGISQGLKHIHEKGIMHGDLKKQNIFFCNNKAQIGDFGLSKKIGDGDKVMDEQAKEHPYMPTDDRYVSAKVDVFSLGVLLVELVLDITTCAQLGKVLGPLKKETKFPENWPDGKLKDWVIKMLKKTPEERISSAEIVGKLKKIKKAIRDFKLQSE